MVVTRDRYDNIVHGISGRTILVTISRISTGICEYLDRGHSRRTVGRSEHVQRRQERAPTHQFPVRVVHQVHQVRVFFGYECVVVILDDGDRCSRRCSRRRRQRRQRWWWRRRRRMYLRWRKRRRRRRWLGRGSRQRGHARCLWRTGVGIGFMCKMLDLFARRDRHARARYFKARRNVKIVPPG